MHGAIDTYHNTTGSHGSELLDYTRKASRQEDVIEQWFKGHPGRLYTPSQLNALLPQAPLTSIRRAISNLTKTGLLQKTDAQRAGPFGRPESLWRLAPAHHHSDQPRLI